MELKKKLKEFWKDYYLVAVLVVAVAAVAWRVYMALQNGMWVDEGRYSLIANSLLKHPFEYSSPYHGIVKNYGPVFPYLLYLSQLVLGQGKLAVYIVSPVIGGLSILMTYLLGKEMFGRLQGFIAAVLLSVSPVFTYINTRILVGSTLSLVYLVAISLMYYGLKDKKYSKYAMMALGPVLALGIITKQPAYFLGGIFLIYLYRKTGFEFLTDYRNHRYVWFAAGLGVITLIPWFVRSFSICGLPLCTIEKVILHITRESAGKEFSTAGSWHYLKTLGGLLSVPVAALVYFRYSAGTVYRAFMEMDVRKVGYVFGGFVLATAVQFLADPRFPRFMPFTVLFAYTLLQDSDERFLLWLWTAVGIGGMSVGLIKVPRYVMFTVPAILLLLSDFLVSIRDLIAENISLDGRKITAVLLVIVAVLGYFSYRDTASRHSNLKAGFQKLEEGGEWFQGKDVNVLATSPRQLMFFSGNDADFDMLSGNKSVLESKIRSGNYSYVVLDRYERTKTEEVKTVNSNWARSSLLTPVKVFRQRDTPAVIVYRINPEEVRG